MATPYEKWQAELAALLAKRKALDAKEAALYKKLHVMQVACAHEATADSGGGMFGYHSCKNCGLDDV